MKYDGEPLTAGDVVILADGEYDPVKTGIFVARADISVADIEAAMNMADEIKAADKKSAVAYYHVLAARGLVVLYPAKEMNLSDYEPVVSLDRGQPIALPEAEQAALQASIAQAG